MSWFIPGQQQRATRLLYHPFPVGGGGGKWKEKGKTRGSVFWFGLQPAKKAPRGHPSPCRDAEENGKKQAENWWVGIRAV